MPLCTLIKIKIEAAPPWCQGLLWSSKAEHVPVFCDSGHAIWLHVDCAVWPRHSWAAKAPPAEKRKVVRHCGNIEHMFVAGGSLVLDRWRWTRYSSSSSSRAAWPGNRAYMLLFRHDYQNHHHYTC